MAHFYPSRREFLSMAGYGLSGIVCCNLLACAPRRKQLSGNNHLEKGPSGMIISIEPTETEYVHITHNEWGLTWELQFPEMITIGPAVIKHFSTIQPRWQKADGQGWRYQWQPDRAYVNQKTPIVYKDKDGQPIYEMITGLALRARITAEESAVCLSLDLTNQTSHTQQMVSCEGGCLRPINTNQSFSGRDYVARSYVSCRGQMVNMPDLHRTLPSRCAYWSDAAGYERPIEKNCEDFWGRSKDLIDAPAIVGMVSADASKAVVLGYEGSESALAGSHCLHSRPEFGDIPPSSTVTRKGYILFGEDIHALAAQLRRRLL